MNTGKQQKPVLTGQRFKTRKRDEKEKFEPTVFRDTIVLGLNEAGGDLDAVAKFLDVTGSRLDYRRYADTLFDILIAGSMLAPGGTRIDEGDKAKVTEHCVFTTEENHANLRRYAQVGAHTHTHGRTDGHTLFDRDLVVPKMEQVGNNWPRGQRASFIVLLFYFSHKRELLSQCLGLKINGSCLSLDFKQNVEHFSKYFNEVGLKELSDFMRVQQSQGTRKELQKELQERLSQDCPIREMVVYVKEEMKRSALQEQAVIGLLWNILMNAVEWNKKEELVTEQALKHLKHYAPLLAAFSTQGQSELVLLLRIQEYCYDNIHFMKSFSKIVVLFYKADVLSEEAILRWYKDTHTTKGKGVFVEQMKKFVEWLQNAEEESESEGEED
uniref:eIF5-mimic protein 1 n=1 Tax=Salmo trutta TaxID=8032 RepID=A0A674ED27_SALTR